jgi:hypothetical protein
MLRLLFAVWLWFAGVAAAHRLEPSISPECANQGKFVGLSSNFELSRQCVLDVNGQLVLRRKVS